VVSAVGIGKAGEDTGDIVHIASTSDGKIVFAKGSPKLAHVVKRESAVLVHEENDFA
jgi:hypothetical protein